MNNMLLNAMDVLQELNDIQDWIDMASVGDLRSVFIQSIVSHIDTCQLKLSSDEMKEMVNSEILYMDCVLNMYSNTDDAIEEISASASKLVSIIMRDIFKTHHSKSEYASLPDDIIENISSFI